MRRLLVALFLLLPACGPQPRRDAPDWTAREIRVQDDFVYVAGGAGPLPTEREAKDAALADAVDRFVRYCRVDVDTFDRVEETYSQAGGATRETASVESRRLVRAKAFVSRATPEKWHSVAEGRQHRAWVLLKVPKSELDRIVSQKDVKLSLDVALYHESQGGALAELEEGSVLSSGEGYALYLKPSDTSFLYVYQVDALGKSARLFPSAAFKTAANPVPAGAELWVPNAKDVLVLDETTGKERLFIFGSREPIKELEESETLESREVEQRIKTMGVASARAKLAPEAVPAPRKPAAVVEVKRKLQAQGEFAYETWFWHR